MPPKDSFHAHGGKCAPLRPIPEHIGDQRPASLAVCEHCDGVPRLGHGLKVRQCPCPGRRGRWRGNPLAAFPDSVRSHRLQTPGHRSQCRGLRAHTAPRRFQGRAPGSLACFQAQTGRCPRLWQTGLPRLFRDRRRQAPAFQPGHIPWADTAAGRSPPQRTRFSCPGEGALL